MKVVSWMGFYPASFPAVTGDLQSAVTTGTGPHHSVAEILIINNYLCFICFCSTK